MQYRFGKRLVSVRSSKWIWIHQKGIVYFAGGHVHPFEALKILQREMPEYHIDNVITNAAGNEATFQCHKKTTIDIIGESIENSG